MSFKAIVNNKVSYFKTSADMHVKGGMYFLVLCVFLLLTVPDHIIYIIPFVIILIIGISYRYNSDGQVIIALSMLLKLLLIFVVTSVFAFDDEVGYLRMVQERLALSLWDEKLFFSLFQNGYKFLTFWQSIIDPAYSMVNSKAISFFVGGLSSMLVIKIIRKIVGNELFQSYKNRILIHALFSPAIFLFSCINLKEALIGFILLIFAYGMLTKNFSITLSATLLMSSIRIHYVVLLLVVVGVTFLLRRKIDYFRVMLFSAITIALIYFTAYDFFEPFIRKVFNPKYMEYTYSGGARFIQMLGDFPFFILIPLSLLRGLFSPTPLQLLKGLNVGLVYETPIILYYYFAMPTIFGVSFASIKYNHKGVFSVCTIFWLIIAASSLSGLTGAADLFRYKLSAFFLLPVIILLPKLYPGLRPGIRLKLSVYGMLVAYHVAYLIYL